MTTQTTKQLTLENGADERMLYVTDGTDEPFAVLNLRDAVEASTYGERDSDPDYHELTDNVFQALCDTLAAGGFEQVSSAEMRLAVTTFVTPGAPYTRKQVTFEAERVPGEFDDLPPSGGGFAPNHKFPTSTRDSLTAGPVTVSIDDPGFSGDRQYEVTSIVVERRGQWSQRLTWNEARQLAAALTQMTDVAENG